MPREAWDLSWKAFGEGHRERATPSEGQSTDRRWRLQGKLEKQTQTPGYAEALQGAGRAVRQQEKWRDPCYWAPLVPAGPN